MSNVRDLHPGSTDSPTKNEVAGMPAEHLAFFTKGKEYRVNMFLATSFSQQKAGEFAMDNSAAPLVPDFSIG